jgi:hypothetical protein
MSQNEKEKIILQKKNLLIALEKSLGIVTTACNKVGLHRSTFYEYYNNDNEFKKSVDEINNVVLDFSESALLKNIEKGDTTAIIFHLKTKGKHRGYIERVENHNLEVTTFDDLPKLNDLNVK